MMVTVANGYDLDHAGRAVGELYRAAGYYLAPRTQGSRRAAGEAQAANGWACRMPAGGMGAVQPLSAKAPEKHSRENSK
jgi:hypothetical protein